jgi:hypothetical protein
MLPNSLVDRIQFKDNGCWEFPHSQSNGYGYVRIKGKAHRAHRLVWQETVGDIPNGTELDHICSNRCCVNPDHLEPVTHSVNQSRAREHITHCPKGHPYDEKNTRMRGNARSCYRCCNG